MALEQGAGLAQQLDDLLFAQAFALRKAAVTE
jgi:hypothetical protein